MNLESLYAIAKKHKDSHKSCGGEPYKYYNELTDFLVNLQNKNDVKILEIGTAIGFTTILLAKAFEKQGYYIETVEMHQEHIDLAKQNIVNNNLNIDNFNFICTEFPHNYNMNSNFFDIVFFDAYGPKANFLSVFSKVLKSGGYLISANTHLKSAEKEYFHNLEIGEQWGLVTEFGDTKIFIKK